MPIDEGRRKALAREDTTQTAAKFHATAEQEEIWSGDDLKQVARNPATLIALPAGESIIRVSRSRNYQQAHISLRAVDALAARKLL